MEIFVQGVRIKLTDEQIAQIDKEERKRKRCRSGFGKMLKHFGFKKADTSDWLQKDTLAFEHVYYNWYAEIQNHGNWDSVWMVGPGLKDSGFPGGYMYDEPEKIETEIISALEKLNK